MKLVVVVVCVCVCVVTCDYVHCRSLCTHGATLPDVAICTHEDEEVGIIQYSIRPQDCACKDMPMILVHLKLHTRGN